MHGRGWWPASRPLDPKGAAKHKLLEHGQELSFSVIVEGADGRVKFDVRLSGDDTSIGFTVGGYRTNALVDDERVGTIRTGWSRSESSRFSKGEPQMIVAQCVWKNTDVDLDALRICRVSNAPIVGPVLLEKPAYEAQAFFAQDKLDAFFIMNTPPGGIDKIRIGATLHSVVIGTKPLP